MNKKLKQETKKTATPNIEPKLLKHQQKQRWKYALKRVSPWSETIIKYSAKQLQTQSKI